MKYLLLFVAAIALAQTVPEVSPIAGKSSVDNSAATEVKPVPNVTALPGTCAVGDQVFKTNATAGQNLYACTSTNTWTVQAGASAAAIGGTITGATDGSILFAHPGAVFAQDNANFKWDDVAHALILGNAVSLRPGISGVLALSVAAGGTYANMDLGEFQIIDPSGNSKNVAGYAGMGVSSDYPVNWYNNVNTSSGTADLGIYRNAAGVLEINNGTPGTFRDLLNRTTTSTTFQSASANPAAAGAVRLANTDSSCWRNGANSGDNCITSSSGSAALITSIWQANHFISNASNPSLTGTVELASGDSIGFRNNANSADILLAKTSGDILQFGSNNVGIVNGATTTNNCVKFNAAGQLVDAGAGCSGGSGTVTVVGAGSLGSIQIVTGGGTTTVQTPSSAATVDSSGNIKGTSIATGATPPSSSVCTAGTAGFDCLGEGTTPTGTLSGTDVLWANSSTHRLDVINNNGTNQQVVVTGGDINTSDQVANLSNVSNASLATAAIAANAITLAKHATQAADTVVMNASGSTAAPAAVAMPTCTTGAVLYNTSTHAWSCVSTGSATTLLDQETLTATQIKALGTGGNAIVLTGALGSAPGSGKYYQVTGITVEYVCSSCTAMSGAGHLSLSFDTGGNYDPMLEGSGQYPGIDAMLASTTTTVSSYYPHYPIDDSHTGNATAQVINKPIYFTNGGSAFTTGNGSLIIDISYIVHSGF